MNKTLIMSVPKILPMFRFGGQIPLFDQNIWYKSQPVSYFNAKSLNHDQNYLTDSGSFIQ